MTYATHSFRKHITLENGTRKAMITCKDCEIEVTASQVAHLNDVRCTRVCHIARGRD
jgi:uncharacterized paraquat-inducible protein A